MYGASFSGIALRFGISGSDPGDEAGVVVGCGCPDRDFGAFTRHGGRRAAHHSGPPVARGRHVDTDDLTDMVLDAIQHGAAPTTTPVPAPPN